MRFVAVKTEEQQARAMLFRTRQMFVRQRTQLINALRGHMAEHGIVAPQGPVNIRELAAALADEDISLPEIVRHLGRVYVDQIASVAGRIADLDRQMRVQAREIQTMRRLQTMPGVGPVTAVAIETFAPPMETFRRGRDFAAWLGLVPRQHSSGGKPRLGKTSKMGQRDIRRLLIVGAMAMIRATLHRGPTANSRLTRMLARKPRILVATALANKMARGLWAMMTTATNYKDPAAATA
jgi:transposase